MNNLQFTLVGTIIGNHIQTLQSIAKIKSGTSLSIIHT